MKKQETEMWHKFNGILTEKERNIWNYIRTDLWLVMDSLRDHYHSTHITKNMKENILKLESQVEKLPIFTRKDELMFLGKKLENNEDHESLKESTEEDIHFGPNPGDG